MDAYNRPVLDLHHRAPFDAAEVEKLKAVILDLLAYCQRNQWAGYDPYDALNSRLFRALPFTDIKLTRLVFIQLLKRFPVNVRKFLLVPETQNPKALALFLSTCIKLSRMGLADKDLIGYMCRRIATLRSPDTSYWCWGYNFPWQTRSLLVAQWAPNLVCTTFVGNALLDVYDYNQNDRMLEMAVSSADYIAEQLFWTRGESIASFSYPTPYSPSLVHNANFLASAFLSRVSAYTGNNKIMQTGITVASYSASRQRPDGSWYYGEHRTQRWIDNFHTGFNLVALDAIIRYTQLPEFESILEKGFQFYSNHFFDSDFIPKYFHDRVYPIDTHCVAQSIITLTQFADRSPSTAYRIHRIVELALRRLRDPNGYFYYQVNSSYKNKIPYMRWSQAWMLYALTILLEHLDD